MRIQDIEIHHLRAFATVAEILNFRKASETLNTTQPALTRRIQQLENALGIALFDRTTRSVRLRPAGAAFLKSIETVFSDIETAATRALQAERGRAGNISIGVADTSVCSFLPDLIYKFRENNPDHEVVLHESSSKEIIEHLMNQKMDCGFMMGGINNPEVSTTLVSRDTFVAVVHKDHPFAQRKSIKFHDLSNEPLILFPRHRNPDFYDQILIHANKLSAFEPVHTAQSRLTTIHMAGAGMGIALIGTKMKYLCPDCVRCIDIEENPLSVEIHLAWNRENPNPLVDMCLQQTEEF